jgi:hypothetical protein
VIHNEIILLIFCQFHYYCVCFSAFLKVVLVDFRVRRFGSVPVGIYLRGSHMGSL